MPKTETVYLGDGVVAQRRGDGLFMFLVRYQHRGTRVMEKVKLQSEKGTRYPGAADVLRTDKTFDDARIFAAARRQRILEDPHFIPPPLARRVAREAEKKAAAERRPDPMFSDLLGAYRAHCMPRRNNQKWQREMTGMLEKRFGGMKLADVTPAEAAKWLEELETHRYVCNRKTGETRALAPESVRKAIFFLSGVFRSVGELRAYPHLHAANPCTGLPLPDKSMGLKRALTAAQASRLLNVARETDELLWRWAYLMLGTGCRTQEARDLRWCDVVEDDGETVLQIHDTKTGKPRVVSPTPALAGRLASWRHEDDALPDDPVIGEEVASMPYRRWRAVFKEAGILWGQHRGGFTARNLRTTFCSLAFKNGAEPTALATQTGHSVKVLMDWYTEANSEQRRKAVGCMPDLERSHLQVAEAAVAGDRTRHRTRHRTDRIAHTGRTPGRRTP